MYLVYLLRVYLLPMSSSRQTATPPIYHKKKRKTPHKKNSSDIGNVKFKADCNSTFTSQPICHRDTKCVSVFTAKVKAQGHVSLSSYNIL